MSDYLIPLYSRVATSTFHYVDVTAMSTNNFTGTKRTATMGGDRLAATLSLSAQQGADRAAMIGWMMQLRGKQNRAILIDHAAKLRGSFPTFDLLANGQFGSSFNSWSASANFALTVQDRVLRTTAVGATLGLPALYLNGTVPTVTGAAYVARFMVHRGRGLFTGGYRIDVGSAVNTNSIATGTALAAFGLGTQTFIASGTAASMRLWILSAGAIGDYLQIPYASLARCLLVDGAAQTGSALAVKSLPASTLGLLLTADLFEVITSLGSELKYLTAPLNSDASGKGYLQFEPPLRGVPADGAPIIVHQPMGRFLYMGSFPTWINDPGVISSATFDFEEAPPIT